MMKVSLLVPIYAVEKYIERCASSLFEQTYNDIEYIFVNDCTRDDSLNILQKVIDKYPKRKNEIKIIQHETNRGLAAARNTAVEAATGNFIMHVDSDDFIEKNTVELCVEEQTKTKADIISFGAVLEYSNYFNISKFPKFDSSKQMSLSLLARKERWTIWGHLINRALYIDNNVRCKEGVNMSEDYHVSPILSYYANKVSNIDQPLYHYNLAAIQSNDYVLKFNQNYVKQTDFSCEVLYNFFCDKGADFLNAYYEGRLNTLINDIICLNIVGGQNDLYKDRCNQIDNVLHKANITIKTRHKIFLRFKRNRFILRVLCRFVYFLRNIIHSTK